MYIHVSLSFPLSLSLPPSFLREKFLRKNKIHWKYLNDE